MMPLRRAAVPISRWAAALLLSLPAIACAGEDAPSGQSLDQAANDPTASLMAVQIQNLYSGTYHRLDDASGNTLLLRPVIPFETGDLKHIARATIPYVTQSPSGTSGLGDSVLFDLIVFNQSWGRWGIGPVMLLPTASDDALGAEKWAAGPALGFIARQPGLMWGLFNQNLVSFAGKQDRDEVKLSIIQPIVNYSLPNKWSIGTSEMNATYDWDKGAWSNLPLGLKLSKLTKAGSLRRADQRELRIQLRGRLRRAGMVFESDPQVAFSHLKTDRKELTT